MKSGKVNSPASAAPTHPSTGSGAVAEKLAARWSRQWPIAVSALERLYGHRPGFGPWLVGLEARVRAASLARAPDLQQLDDIRENGPSWSAPDMIGYSAYVDRLAGTVTGLNDKLPYLAELGVRYLHLLPLSKPRQGDSDGGYAVADFEAVDPALGTMEDLTAFARNARAAGISLVVDLVCNHTADDHRWAKAARAGDPRYIDYYHFVAERAEVEALESDLLDVFPDTAPGNFTYVAERSQWVWTTFYPFQWDLNYSNPVVFEEMLSVLLNLSNRGVEGFRLDSAPFLWKRPGTNSRNQPEVHDVLAAWRALLSIAAPGVVLKAEAIERLEDVLPYFGGRQGPPECDLAYNNGVMAGLWASLASGDTYPTQALMKAAQAKPDRGLWINYLRCHDDIIFSALAPHVSAAAQARSARFLAGEAPGSFAKGRIFQVFGGVPSINGMASSLAGVTSDASSPGVARLLLLYGVLFALDGIPVIYMGDEIALENDEHYADEPTHAAEGRWLQRPRMDWRRAGRRADRSVPEGRVFQNLTQLGRIRATQPALAATSELVVLDEPNSAVLSFARGRGDDLLHVVANFGASVQTVEAVDAAVDWIDLLTGDEVTGRRIELSPYQVRWLRRAV